MTVRSARPEDLTAIREILRLSPQAAQWVPDVANTQVAEDGEVVGVSVVLILGLDEAEILNLAVHPTCRRAGIASSLLDAIPYRVLHLEVRASNSAAVALYRKSGFEQVGIRSRYYTDPAEDAVLFTRTRWSLDTRETVL